MSTLERDGVPELKSKPWLLAVQGHLMTHRQEPAAAVARCSALVEEAGRGDGGGQGGQFGGGDNGDTTL